MRRSIVATVIASLLMFAGEFADARAQTTSPLPQGTITLIVPLAAGGPIDVVARLLADKISNRSGRTIVVENKAGAAGNIGATAVARSEPNGATWLLTVDSLFTVNPHMYANQGFDPDKDLVPVGQLGQVVLMLAIHPKVPAKTWAELLAYSKTKPLNFGSAGIGAPGHLALEYLKTVSALDAAHVPFRGANPALIEVLAGNVDAAFIVAGVMVDHVRSGALRALAVSDSKRFALFPDVPTAAEAGIPGFEARFTNILAVPSKTPEAVRSYLAAEMVAFAALDDVKAKFGALGSEILVSDETATRAWIAQERERWGKVVRSANLKAN